jgi:hypothetical protein
MKWFATFLLLFSLNGFSQEKTETHELLGQVGGRPALLHLYGTEREDGSARLTGEYLVLPTMQQRFLEGDRSKQLGVTVLREGNSPILYGREPIGTLQGNWSGGVFKGTRFGPQGQERERFEFSETFPSLDAYNANVRCEVIEGRYSATLAYAAEAGRLKAFEWRSKVAPAGHPFALAGLEQRPFKGGLQLERGRCRVTLRDLGDFVRVTAEHCAEFCGSETYLEPVLVDRRGCCALLWPQTRQ